MRSHRLWRALSERRGEGYVDVIVLVLCAVMVLALAMRVLPIFIQKQQLDTFATELVREAEVSGRVGTETSRRAAVLSEKTGLYPDILWSSHGRIQLNEEVTCASLLESLSASSSCIALSWAAFLSFISISSSVSVL